jgi:hypothetical protein
MLVFFGHEAGRHKGDDRVPEPGLALERSQVGHNFSLQGPPVGVVLNPGVVQGFFGG